MILLPAYSLHVQVSVETTGQFGLWGLSQLPSLIQPFVTMEGAAHAPSVWHVLLVGTIIGMALVLPSLYSLFWVCTLPYPAPGKQEEQAVAKKDASVGMS
jgi:cytochrome bd-type quinol oxidase subunit 2